MFTIGALVFIWFSGLLAGHFSAVLLEKQQVVDDLLRTYVDIFLHAVTEGGRIASIFLHNFGSSCIVVSDYIGCWLEQSLNYAGSSLVATLVFLGAAISETVNFVGATLSASLRVSGQVMSHSLDYVGV